jgi:hypothetical protein
MGLEEPWSRVRVLSVLRSAGRGRNVDCGWTVGCSDVPERSIDVKCPILGTMLLAMVVRREKMMRRGQRKSSDEEEEEDISTWVTDRRGSTNPPG